MRKKDADKRTGGSVLIDTLVAIMVCAIILGSLAPLLSRIVHLQSRMIREVDIIADSTTHTW